MRDGEHAPVTDADPRAPLPDPVPTLPDGGADADEPPRPGEPELRWEFPPPRSSRRVLWITLSLLAGVAVLAVAAWISASLLIQAHEEAMAARTVTAAQQEVVEAELARLADVVARTDSQRAAYQETLAIWNAEQEQAAAWRTGTDAPVPSLGNPGGATVPGGDPAGFLASIGAPQVQVLVEAGAENCGFQAGAGDPRTRVVGGCFSTRYPNWVFLAWEPGTEDAVWAIFVHEVMHWYQYQTLYAAFLAADRLGIPERAYVSELEADASCRAVYVHGIPSWRYASTSAPCGIDGWYEGWLLDHLASLGVPTAPPVAEEYEVAAVVRP